MREQSQTKLLIDPEFRSLIRPLTEEEHTLLEMNLKEYGCMNPIVVWNDIIIDGHNRYEICTKLGIPFDVKEMSFSSRDEVRIWICNFQLSRRNLSEEARRYLIGKKYELEKRSQTMLNQDGRNQYTPKEELYKAEAVPKTDTAGRIGSEDGICRATVLKYARYSEAVDRIADVTPAVRSRILAGQCKVSQESIVKMARMEDKAIKSVGSKLLKTTKTFVPYSTSRRHIEGDTDKAAVELKTAIKQMPDHDPNMEIMGLVMTMPSWVQSIGRIGTSHDITQISTATRAQLEEALLELQIAIEELMEELDKK